MPTSGGVGDFAEIKDSSANVDSYVSAAGEYVTQYGFAVVPLTVSATGALPTSASNVEVGTIAAAVTLTLPAAGAVTPGHVLWVHDVNGTVSSSATVALQTASSASGKIGGVAAGSASTSAAAYAFLNSAYSAVRLVSNGTNWNPA